MRRILIMAVVALTVLALWSAWNPGWYYLGRFALFTALGALLIYLVVGRRHRYSVAAALFYAAAICGVVAVVDMVSSPEGQIESISVFLVPLAIFLLLVTILAAVVGPKEVADPQAEAPE